MNVSNVHEITSDFEEEATIKELVGEDGSLEDVIEQAETGLLDGFLDYFLDNGAAQKDPFCHLLDQICTDPSNLETENVMGKENKENEDRIGNGLVGQQSYNAVSFGRYPDQQADSSIGPIRKTEKKRANSRPYEIRTPVHVAINKDVTIKNILDTSVLQVIDTKKTVGDVKNWCKMNRVNQTKFAEKVLEKTQGHYSVISRNPAPWEELLAPGKAVFVRMHNFMKLSDEEKMKILSVEKEQMEVLMEIYKVNNQPGKELIQELAEKFSLYPNQIKGFFLNRRRRAKRSNF